MAGVDQCEPEMETEKSFETEEDALERLAMEELLKEAKRGAERAKDMGPAGWLKNHVPRANKRFLQNTVMSTLRGLERRPKKESDSQRSSCNGRHRKYSTEVHQRKHEKDSKSGKYHSSVHVSLNNSKNKRKPTSRSVESSRERSRKTEQSNVSGRSTKPRKHESQTHVTKNCRKE